jgi:hypothetical protein
MQIEHFFIRNFLFPNSDGVKKWIKSALHIKAERKRILIQFNYIQSEKGGKNLPTAWITKSISSSAANQARLNLRTFTSLPNVYSVQQTEKSTVCGTGPCRLHKHKCSVSVTVKRQTI